MAKDKMTVTISPEVLATVDEAARASGLTRSGYVEDVLRTEHYRRLLAQTPAPPDMSEDEQRGLRGLLDWQRDAGTGDAQGAA
jgi:hypothetical protein